MIYLATPYSDSNPAVRDERFRKACELTSRLAAGNVPCYSPIAFWHQIAEDYAMPGDAEFWKIQDHDCLALCSELWIITMEGWNRSKGVAMEQMEFQRLHNSAGIVFLYSPFEIDLACEEYHERRNAKRDALVSEQMQKTASVEAGFGLGHTDVAPGQVTITGDLPAASGVGGQVLSPGGMKRDT